MWSRSFFHHHFPDGPIVFTDQEARDAWNAGARAFDAFVLSGADYYRAEVHGPGLLAACGDLRGKRALDLGCGQGYFTRELAKAGAQATGVELAEELLAFAKRHEAASPVGADYVALNAIDVARQWPAATFDLVTSCMAVHDMADIPAVLRSAHSVLKEDGRFVFSVPHPCTETAYREWERDADGRKLSLRIDRYFESGPARTEWNMPRLIYQWTTPFWRRTLSEWSALSGDSGFVIRRMHEPRPTEAQVQGNPNLEGCYRLPYFLVFDLTKESRTR